MNSPAYIYMYSFNNKYNAYKNKTSIPDRNMCLQSQRLPALPRGENQHVQEGCRNKSCPLELTWEQDFLLKHCPRGAGEHRQVSNMSLNALKLSLTSDLTVSFPVLVPDKIPVQRRFSPSFGAT